MATIAGLRELPKPRKASQPSYPPDHSPLIGIHPILFFWPWRNPEAAPTRESSALNKPSTQMDKHVSNLLATMSTNEVPREGGDW